MIERPRADSGIRLSPPHRVGILHRDDGKGDDDDYDHRRRGDDRYDDDGVDGDHGRARLPRLLLA